MGKVFAVIVVVIALASAIPIITHTWFGTAIRLAPPEDISTHGHAIDEQLAETMVEAGFHSLLHNWSSPSSCGSFLLDLRTAEIRIFPGRCKVLVIAALVFVGTEVLALGVLGRKPGLPFTSRRPSRMPSRFRCRRDSSHSISAIPGPDGKFGGMHPDKIDEGNSNFFGLDPANDVEARDDIVSAELAIPVNQRSASADARAKTWVILSTFASCASSRISFPALISRCTSPPPRPASTKLSAPSSAAWGTTT